MLRNRVFFNLHLSYA